MKNLKEIIRLTFLGCSALLFITFMFSCFSGSNIFFPTLSFFLYYFCLFKLSKKRIISTNCSVITGYVLLLMPFLFLLIYPNFFYSLMDWDLDIMPDLR